MLKKYLKYALLLNAEVTLLAAKKIQTISEDFVKKNTDKDYEESLSKVFDNIEQKVRDLSPHLEKVNESVNKIKDLKENVVDFSKKKFKVN